MDIGKLLSESWAKFTGNLGMAIGLYIVAGVVGGLLCGLTLGIVGIPVFAGMFKAFRKLQRGEAVDFSDLFSEFSNFSKWFMLWVVGLAVGVVIGILSAITGGLGSILGVVAGFFLFFVIQLMLEKDMGAFDAVKESISKVTSNFGTYGLAIILALVIAGAGSAVFGIGVLVTAPWMLIASWMIYDAAYGQA